MRRDQSQRCANKKPSPMFSHRSTKKLILTPVIGWFVICGLVAGGPWLAVPKYLISHETFSCCRASEEATVVWLADPLFPLHSYGFIVSPQAPANEAPSHDPSLEF